MANSNLQVGHVAAILKVPNYSNATTAGAALLNDLRTLLTKVNPVMSDLTWFDTTKSEPLEISQGGVARTNTAAGVPQGYAVSQDVGVIGANRLLLTHNHPICSNGSARFMELRTDGSSGTTIYLSGNMYKTWSGGVGTAPCFTPSASTIYQSIHPGDFLIVMATPYSCFLYSITPASGQVYTTATTRGGSCVAPMMFGLMPRYEAGSDTPARDLAGTFCTGNSAHLMGVMNYGEVYNNAGTLQTTVAVTGKTGSPIGKHHANSTVNSEALIVVADGPVNKAPGPDLVLVDSIYPVYPGNTDWNWTATNDKISFHEMTGVIFMESLAPTQWARFSATDLGSLCMVVKSGTAVSTATGTGHSILIKLRD